ncbi:MAG: ABC transporter ATP-binding protein [Chitinophagales bacterium]|nr:ABC transporter ATP-binding protein [Chitinophagales bacterium]
MKHLSALNKYFYRYKFTFLIGVLFVALSNIFSIMPPQAIRYAFDLVKDDIAYYQLFSGFALQERFYSIFSRALLLFGVSVLLMAILRGVFMFLMRQTLIVMSRHIEFDLRNDMYAHYQKLSTAFYKRNRTGDLMSRATEDVIRVRMYLGPAIMYSVNTIVTLLTVTIIMFQTNATLTAYVLLPLPFLSIFIYYINSIIHRRSEEIQAQMSKLTSIAQETFSGIRLIKAYVQEKANVHFFDQESDEYRHKSIALARTQALFAPSMLLLVGMSTVLTIYIGGKQVIDGTITSGNIAEFVLYVNMLTWPVASLGWVTAMIQRAAASQKRINAFLDTPPDIVSPNNQAVQLKGNLQFDQVTFTYPDTQIKALKKVSFTLRKGEKMAIVGRTGSGKSTIAELLVRNYDIDEGKILLDQQDIQQLNLAALRQQIGYVPQDVFLFSDTINNNIAFGAPEVGETQIQQAAKDAAVYKDIIQLPDRFSTVVGERGVTLSGGQKQRVSLARALVKQPPILLLDDCLSAVDAITEQAILEHLSTYLADRTAIVITHRIFTSINFDKILVLEQGEVAEMGTHEELLAQNGIYANLYEKQHQETTA